MQYNLHQVAKELGVSVHTIRYWIKEGNIKTVRTVGGHHRVRKEELERLLGKREEKAGEIAVIYCRVSSSENKKNLASQAQRLSEYANAKGYQIEKTLQEVGSGINDQRQKLKWLLDYVVTNRVNRIVVEHKDRLTRFGFAYLERYFQNYGVEIEIVNKSADAKEDLINDFVAIITSFVARLYGLRRSKRKTEQLIRDLKDKND